MGVVERGVMGVVEGVCDWEWGVGGMIPCCRLNTESKELNYYRYLRNVVRHLSSVIGISRGT